MRSADHPPGMMICSTPLRNIGKPRVQRYAKTGVLYHMPRHIAKWGRPLPYFMRYRDPYYAKKKWSNKTGQEIIADLITAKKTASKNGKIILPDASIAKDDEFTMTYDIEFKG